ncbi:N-acetylglucosamine-6-phosphate deacetylase, partial [Paenibacillus sp. 28ISP30-2]|nr:N-acetylglucosamine-6-phosphate deacetylase [Paenibacillus sp. 28ISP30-2]
MNSDETNGGLTQLLYGQVVIGDHMIEKGVVAIEGQSIVYAGAEDDLPADLVAAAVQNKSDGAAVGANIVRLEGGYLLPGFLDIHS